MRLISFRNNYIKIIFTIILGLYCGLLLLTYGQLFRGFHLGNFFPLLVSDEILFSIGFSLATSLSALLLSFLIGIPSAYILARENFPGKGILESFLYLPVFLPPLVSGLALVLLVSQGAGGFLESRGIEFMFSSLGVVTAQAFIATPLAIRSFQTAFQSVDPKLEQAAESLGDSPGKVFYEITFPLAWKGILTGLLLAWARALGEFGATIMLAGAIRMKTETLPISIYLNMSLGNLENAIAVGILMLIIAVVILTIFHYLIGFSSIKNRLPYR
ncbi:ABC transporter permease [Natranaerobius thermophilus]|uniref:NifC-like ABC-type porter n=1 Tax=Natranaerobius thermophilus (strain ATCC BAA-1301 / DSM 18059 / JW/NM-WN-LF) TaxID=457570 RepID=B2A801_NATTJ|nr:NifC-like ABC-type porter [Natranaerobius thermophilus JW/NM-WN-LF]